MKALLLLVVAASSGLAAISNPFLPKFAIFNKRSSLEHPEVAKRQAVSGKKRSRYGTVVARSPFKLESRDTLNSPSVPVNVKLAAYSADQSTLLGYLAPNPNFNGDYTYVSSPTDASTFTLTLGTNGIQKIPIVSPPAGTYPLLAGVSGASNTGSTNPPYIPSTDFGSDSSPTGQNYAYLSNAQDIAHGPAQSTANSDNSTPFAQTGMFQLTGTLLRQLSPAWVNNDGTVVPNQLFGLDPSNNLIMYGSQTDVNNAYGTIAPIYVTYIPA